MKDEQTLARTRTYSCYIFNDVVLRCAARALQQLCRCVCPIGFGSFGSVDVCDIF